MSGVTDFGFLEIEVHLYDDGSGYRTFLGCSGQDSGLRGVDEADRLYAVRADFQKAEDPTSRLLLGDVVGKWLRVEVWEDDYVACPAQPSTGLFGVDQLLGLTTLPIGPDFERAVLSFGAVPRLVLEKGRT